MNERKSKVKPEYYIHKKKINTLFTVCFDQ